MTRNHTPVMHYEIEILDDTVFAPLCENGRDAFEDDDDVEMTDDERFVTCPKCLRELGIEQDTRATVERDLRFTIELQKRVA